MWSVTNITTAMLVAMQQRSTFGNATQDAGHLTPMILDTQLVSSPGFFICASQIHGMNGFYRLSDEMHAEDDTPVYIREDEQDKTDQENPLAVDASDFRLFRRHGFWMFADVGQWPPTTHFRCDPTKRDIPAVNTFTACGINRAVPPLMGYSPANPSHPVGHLILQQEPCQQQLHASSTAKSEL